MTSSVQPRMDISPKPKRLTRNGIAALSSLVVLVLSLLLFALACVAPAGIDYGDGGLPRTGDGLYFLALGWLGPLIGAFGWYANPLLALSWVFLLLATLIGRLALWSQIMRACALASSLWAFLVGLTTFLYVPHDTGPQFGHSTQLDVRQWEIGLYLWFASMAVITISMFIVLAVPGVKQRQERESGVAA